MRITKEVDFAAAHSIAGTEQCDQKHGHNWHAVIEIDHAGGEITDKRGFLVDVREVKNAAYKYDHDDLDKYFDFASTENVAQQIAEDALQACIECNPGAQFFVRVHLDETKNNSADAGATNVKIREMNDAGFREVGYVGARNNEPESVRREGFLQDQVVSKTSVIEQKNKELGEAHSKVKM